MEHDHMVTLVPLNEETRSATGQDRIRVTSLPFRVGRESRFRMVDGRMVSMERRNQDSRPNNELYVLDQEQFLNISREHFQIERTAEGGLEVVDRNSTCGTIVDDVPIGTAAGRMRAPLKSGSIIRVGTPGSPFHFRVEIAASDPGT